MNVVDTNLAGTLNFGMPTIPTIRKSLFDYENPLTKLKSANKSNTDFLNRKPQSASPFKSPMFFIPKGKKTIVTTQGQLKNVAGSRRVTLEGSALLDSYIKSVFAVQNDIKGDFVDANWQIAEFQFIGDPNVGRFDSRTPITIKITADVYNTHSLQNIKDSATKLLQNYSTVSGSRLSGITLRATDSETNYGGNAVTEYSAPKTKRDKQSGGETGSGSSLIDGIGSTLSNAVTGWATASGYLLPVAALGTVIVLAIAIKK